MTYDANKLLVTVEDGLEYLGIDHGDDADEVGFLIQAVSEMFDAATDRHLLASAHTEYYVGNGTATIYLRNYPVTSTTDNIDIRVDPGREFGTDSRVTELWLENETGAVVRKGRWFGQGVPIRAVYNAGYTTVPHDLRLATMNMLSVVWGEKDKKQFNLASMTIGDINYQYLDRIPHKVAQTLMRYRRHG